MEESLKSMIDNVPPNIKKSFPEGEIMKLFATPYAIGYMDGLKSVLNHLVKEVEVSSKFMDTLAKTS